MRNMVETRSPAASQRAHYAKNNKKPPRFREGFFVSIIVSRRFPSLADLAATYSSKP